MALITSRRFAPLFWCQFFSVLNDNFLKNALVFLIAFKVGESQELIQLTAAVLMIPFFFLSGLGGEIADRYDKAIVAQRLKLFEIAVAGFAALGFIFHSLILSFFALFLFGVIGALFSPIKYGALPDYLKREELPAGNAMVEGGTFIGIVLGGIIAGVFAKDANHFLGFSVMMIGIAVAAWLTTTWMRKTGEAAPSLRIDKNIFRSTFGLLRDLRTDRRLWWGGHVTSWFWAVGAVVVALLMPLVEILGGVPQVFTAYLTIFAVAIGIGSALAAWLAHGRIILLPAVMGGVIISLFAIDLGIATLFLMPETTFATVEKTVGSAFSTGQKMGLFPVLATLKQISSTYFDINLSGISISNLFLASIGDVFSTLLGWRIAVDLCGLAIGGGLFIVPVFAAVQAWAAPERRARVVAGVNVLNAGYIVVGSLIAAALQKMVGISGLFLIMGGATFVVAIIVGFTMPSSAMRDLLSILFRSIYRLKVHGAENFAKAGPNTVIAVNHVSFLDAALAVSLLNEDPIFAIDYKIAQRWWVKPFLRFVRAMPLDPTKPMATRTLINAVKTGETLIIFPEGRLTVTGSLMKVYDGAGLIADKSDATIVPVRIDGLEATPFSLLSRKQVRRRWFPKVTVTVLEPVKLTVSPELKGKRRRQAAGAALYSVMSDLVFQTTSTDRTVFEAAVEAAKIHGRNRIATEDALTGKLSYKRLLAGAAVLGRKFMTLAKDHKTVGVMLPNSNAAAVTFFGLVSAGYVPAMINFTAGVGNILSAYKAAKTTMIITARGFIEKAKLGALVEQLAQHVEVVYLEDIRATVTLPDKLRGLWQANEPLAERKADDPAAILFTSGSEGTPKGVVLSRRNMLANAAQAMARIDFGRADKLFNVLPVFHSFGLTVGLVLPVISGVHVFLYPSPLHYRIVPELVYDSNATIMFGTDTFLAGYARMAHAYDFRSLRYVLAGAEAVKASTRWTYLEKFGLRILEGYGVTETAPVLALNTPMFNRFGTVGRIMPGMEARLEPVPGVTEGGRLFVRGPNVMLGYLRAENPGVIEPPADGWHDTGDIVTIDANGFVTIKGRAKRFAKIGGEMVSLAAIETLAAELWPGLLSAVGTVPDMRKGEKLVLLTQKRDATRREFQAFARSKGASELMIPAEVIVEENIPVLGSGKLDFASVQKRVTEHMARKQESQAVE
jgi:acyl-[acyl-carrier-protein]-phospholipid O-acyltransferase/long-chain-fatty-acid--[acyl-carrier-protein] ligase